MNKITFVFLLVALFAITKAHPQVSVADSPDGVHVVDGQPAGGVNVVDGDHQIDVVDNAGPEPRGGHGGH